jgi:hypothetical protein
MTCTPQNTATALATGFARRRRTAPSGPRRQPPASRVGLALVCALLPLASGGCFLFGHRRTQPPILVINQPAIVILPPIVTNPNPSPQVETRSTGTAKAQTSAASRDRRRPREPQRPPTEARNNPPAQPPPAKPVPAPPPAVTAGLTPDAAQRYRSSTEQLLVAVRNDIESLAHRNLNNEQSATMAQAGEYARESQQALNQSDVLRAYSLANKAFTLTQALIRGS